jgi:hypothetical protein
MAPWAGGPATRFVMAVTSAGHSTTFVTRPQQRTD